MVAINDEYQGIYTLNIPKDKWMFGMTDGTKECILTAETHAKGTQFAEEGNVQTVVSNFLVDIPKGLLDQEVVLWPKIPGTKADMSREFSETHTAISKELTDTHTAIQRDLLLRL